MGTRPVAKQMSKIKVADFEIIKRFRPILFLITSILDIHKKEKRVKQSRYRLRGAQRVQGS